MVRGPELWGSDREKQIQAVEISFSTGCLGSPLDMGSSVIREGHRKRAAAPTHWALDQDASLESSFRHATPEGGPATDPGYPGEISIEWARRPRRRWRSGCLGLP